MLSPASLRLPFLAASLLALTAPPAAAFYGAKFEPPDGKIEFGAGQHPVSSAAIQNAMPPDRKPSVIATYDDISNDEKYEPIWWMYETNMFPGARFQIGLWWLDHQHDKIISGQWDSLLLRMVRSYKDLGHDVHLRVGYEPNGNFPGNAAKYKQAYRHIVNFFRAQGVQNVAYAWNPNNRLSTYEAWYPGDDVVDWITYNRLEGESDNASDINNSPFLTFARQHQKPVYIGELSQWHADASSWINTMTRTFKGISESGEVKGFQFINYPWRSIWEWRGYRDCAFTMIPAQRQAFVNTISGDKYLYRDAGYHNPNALVVAPVRMLEAGSLKKGGAWEKSFDFYDKWSDYDYDVKGAKVFLGPTGWDVGWQMAAGSASQAQVDLTVPANASGYIGVNFRPVDFSKAMDFYIGSRKVLAAYRKVGPYTTDVVWACLQFEFRPSDIVNGKVTVRIRNTDGSNADILVQEIRIQTVHPSAPAAPGGVTASNAGKPAVSWQGVAGAEKFNIYRDNVLVGFSKGTSFTDHYADPARGYRYQVTAWDDHLGEGWMSAQVLGGSTRPDTGAGPNPNPNPVPGDSTYGFNDLAGDGEVNGLHGGIDFGTGAWAGGADWAGLVKAGCFKANVQNGSFTLPPGRVLKSLKVSSTVAGCTYSIRDGVNTAKTGTLQKDTPLLLETGWKQGGRKIDLTVCGWDFILDDITFGAASAPTALGPRRTKSADGRGPNTVQGVTEFGKSGKAAAGAGTYDLKGRMLRKMARIIPSFRP